VLLIDVILPAQASGVAVALRDRPRNLCLSRIALKGQGIGYQEQNHPAEQKESARSDEINIHCVHDKCLDLEQRTAIERTAKQMLVELNLASEELVVLHNRIDGIQASQGSKP
jgi:hypothetical protein